MSASSTVARSPVPDVATPWRGGSPARARFSGQTLPALVARLGAALGALLGRPVRLFGRVIAARHADVLELLSRDLEFRIAPVNEAKILAVNAGHFLLSLDRGAQLAQERQALYTALAGVDLGELGRAAAVEAEQLLDAAGASVDVVGGYARLVAAGTARRLFGIGHGIDPVLFMDVVRTIFDHTFLNLSDDRVIQARALRAAPLMQGWLTAEIARRRAAGEPGRDMMGGLLRQPALGDDTVRRTLGGMLVGSIDPTAGAVARIVAVLAADRRLLDQVVPDLDAPERLRGWCWEALRRWPNGPVVMRRAAADTVFGGVRVRRGDLVIAWTQAAMLDASVFPQPAAMRPDRPPGAYLHFGGGLHPCAGRALNAVQIPLLVGALLRRGLLSAGPVEWAGAFPGRLVVRLRGAA